MASLGKTIEAFLASPAREAEAAIRVEVTEAQRAPVETRALLIIALVVGVVRAAIRLGVNVPGLERSMLAVKNIEDANAEHTAVACLAAKAPIRKDV